MKEKKYLLKKKKMDMMKNEKITFCEKKLS